MEEQYIPTLSQKLFRVVLGTVLVPFFGDICILWLIVIVSGEKFGFGILFVSYIVAIACTGIPTLIMRLLIEFTTQKLKWRLILSCIFAVFLGCYLSFIIDKQDFYKSLLIWIPSSLIAVLITEWILYKHIQYCVEKDKFAAFNYAKKQMHKRNRQKQIQETD